MVNTVDHCDDDICKIDEDHVFYNCLKEKNKGHGNGGIHSDFLGYFNAWAFPSSFVYCARDVHIWMPKCGQHIRSGLQSKVLSIFGLF